MAPRGINRPGYSSPSSAKRGVFAASPRTPTNINRPGRNDNDRGPNIVMKSKPSIPSPALFSRDRGQSGGINSISPAARAQYYQQQDPYALSTIRQNLFDNRPIPTERLQRRSDQARLLQEFKDKYTYQQPGTNVYQMKANAPMSLSDYTMQLANQFGPTPKELMGDAGYALSSIGKGLAEKGTPMMNLVKSLFGGIQDLFTGPGGQGTTAQGPQNLGLTPGQMNIYNNLVGNGMNPAMALEQAKRYIPKGNFPKSFAVGGIATLN